MSVVEQRRSARFDLQLPLRIVRTGVSRVSHDSLTQNISSGGVLFTSEVDAPIGGAIEYVVTLSAERDRHVDLRCFGKVVRLEKSRSKLQSSNYLIAATVDRYQLVRHES
jgi:PilZ domain